MGIQDDNYGFGDTDFTPTPLQSWPHPGEQNVYPGGPGTLGDQLNKLAYAGKKAALAVIASDEKTFGISGKTIQQEGAPKPRNYGYNLLGGNVVESWTSLTDTWGPYLKFGGAVKMEVLNLIIDYGDGPDGGIEENQIYINNELIEKISNVEYQERLGTMDQTVMTGFEKKKKEYRIDQQLLEADEPFVFTTPHSWCDDVEFTLHFPGGLIAWGSNNYPFAAGVEFLIQVSVKDAGVWTTIFDSTLNEMQDEPFFKLYTVNTLVPGTITRGDYYDIKFSRITADATVDYMHLDSYLRSIREVADVEFTRPGRALLGLKALASSSLSGIDVKVLRKGRVLATYDAAGVETIEFSNNRAWVVWDLLTLPAISGDGDGTPYVIARLDGKEKRHMDMDFFYEWSVFCDEEIDDGKGGTEPRCPCNISITNFIQNMRLAEAISVAGRANLYQKASIVTGWVDDAVATPIDLVTMDTIMDKSWSNGWAEPDNYTGSLEVVFADSDKGYEEDFIEYSEENFGRFRKVLKLPGMGLPTKGTAIHFARYLLESQKLILNINTFKVAKPGFRYKPGDVIGLQCRPANWAAGFRVASSTADTITVDRDAESEVTAGDVMFIRSYDTIAEAVAIDLYIVDSVVGNVITSTTNWDITPLVDNIVAVGDIKLRRIISIRPKDFTPNLSIDFSLSKSKSLCLIS